MNLQQIQDRLALKDLVDTFSNLADEKKVAEQMPLFTQDAVVNTYIGGKLVFEMHGVAEIEQVFTTFLTPFHSVYHLNGQHTVPFIDENNATAINYCAVKLVEPKRAKRSCTITACVMPIPMLNKRVNGGLPNGLRIL